MKTGTQHLRFFILLFVVPSLLVHFPSDFEAFAAAGDVDSTVEINDSTANGPNLANDNFGQSVANIGDLDGDGVQDLAVGAHSDDAGGTNRGAVHIIFMNTNGSVDSTVEINSNTTNGPTLSDGDFFGFSVAKMGDRDDWDGEDGIVLAVGAPRNGASDIGAVHIMFVNTNGSVDSTVEINNSSHPGNGPTLGSGDFFGDSLANIGDLDGDGVEDLAVGTTRDDAGGTNRGAVHIMFMNANGTPKSTVKIDDSTANGPDLGDRDYFGRSIANMGDRDGWDGEDGIVLAVGATRDNAGEGERGAVHIVFVNTNGSVDSTVEIDDSTANGPNLANDDKFGRSSANIGDMDGDGVDDLAVGAVNDDVLHIMFMNANGTPKSTIEIDESTARGPDLSNGDGFGRSSANIGDLDLDGIDDLAVGANGDDVLHIMFMEGVTTPSQVGTVTPTCGNAQSALSWSAPATRGAAITDYIIQYSTDNSTWSTFSDGTSTSTSATVTSLTNGTLYYFKVAAVNSVGTGTYSSAVSCTPATTPSQVGTVTPTCGNVQSALSWSAPATGGAAITDYIIQYSTDNSTWSTFSDGTSTSTSATVTSLTNGTLYYFKVAAVNSVGTGTYSSAVSCTPATTPSQVTSCTAEAFTGEAQLSWTAPATGGAAITDYIPQYSTDNSNWSTFSDGTSTSTSVTVTGLTNGVLYYFKVAAVNSVGTGSYCSSTSVTVDEYSTDFQWFPAGGSIGAGTTGECADFTAGTQTFGRGVIFGLKNGIPDGQVWEHDDVTFSQFMKFTGANDFTAVTQTFETGTSFGIDTTFNDGQTLPQYTITSSGVLLEEITCGTDTSSNTCIPNDVTKYLSPGEFLTTGIDTTETYSCISSNDKSFTIDGMGVTMSFDTIATSGDVKLDYYDPANVPTATANADGSVSISLASATGKTIGSIIDLSLETAAVTGDITITLSYLEANIPSGSTESDLVVLHYVNNAWKTEDNCTIDTTNNKITCTVSSLSPFGIGISTPNTSATSATSASSGCSSHIILGNCGTIAINNDEYRIIDAWTDVPTTEVLVGQPVTVTLSTLNNPTYTKIHFASVYTEVFDSPTNFEQSAHVDYSVMNNKVTYVSQSQLFQVAGATHRITEDPNTKNLDWFEVVFTMIFAKPMDTSHVVVETVNKFGIPETLYLTSALKVNENLPQALTLEEKSKFELEYKPSMDLEPSMDPEPPMVPDVKNVTCGEGTVLKDNLCVPKEWSFLDFFEQLMRLFG